MRASNSAPDTRAAMALASVKQKSGSATQRAKHSGVTLTSPKRALKRPPPRSPKTSEERKSPKVRSSGPAPIPIKKVYDWTSEDYKENLARKKIAEDKSGKPSQTSITEYLKPNFASKTFTTRIDRPKPVSLTELSEGLGMPSGSGISSKVPLCKFVAETDYSAEPRRLPNICDAKRRERYKEIHDLYFIGWGQEYMRYKK